MLRPIRFVSAALGIVFALLRCEPVWAASGSKVGAAGQPDNIVNLTAEQVVRSKIEVKTVGPGRLLRATAVPGNVLMDPDLIGHVPVKVVGTVVELRKRLGDTVQKGEIVAFLDSREVADAKSEYLTAGANLDLQANLFERERALWDKKISPEQQFLRAENAFAVSKIRHDLARQKLSALDVDEAEIADLPKQPVSNLRRYALRSTIGGRVIERKVDLGAPVGGDQQEKEIYVIADLSSVWVELIAPPSDFTFVREGDRITIAGGGQMKAVGKLLFVSPMVSKETRATRAIVALDNADQRWRPGSFVSADIPIDERSVALLLPKSALQTVNGKSTAFVRVPEGFQARTVETGVQTEEAVEIVAGLQPGEVVAVTNTFILKSDLGTAKGSE